LTPTVTRCVATAVAVCLAALPAWGHTFPPVRTVVLQVERCEAVLLVGYRPASGETTDTILARVASQPRARQGEAMRSVLASYAMAPLALAVDGKRLQPSKIEAKIGVEPGGARPMLIALVTYPLPPGGTLAITSADPRSTSISWQDRTSDRVDLAASPAQDVWYAGVASFLLTLSRPTGVSACTSTSRSD
jgi:hypothetical protein